jgi:NHLM bacteriocin system ABC transporter peptidase/ATP-binding protein
LVVEGFGKGKVYLNDPAVGPRVVTDEEFDHSFTGVVLSLKPGPGFTRGGSRPSVMGALRRRLTGSRQTLCYVVLVSAALVILQFVVPAFTRIYIDRFIVPGQFSALGPLLLAMSLAVVAVVLFTWLQQRALLRFETKLSLSTSSAFLWHVLRLPTVFFSQRFAGEIANRVAINDTVAGLLSGELATNLLGLLLIVLFVLIMLQYDVVLTLIAVGVAALNIVALRYVQRKRTDQNQKLLMVRGQLVGTATNGLRSIETLKANGAESDFFARWAGYQANVMNAEQELGISTQLLGAVPPFLAALNTAFIFIIGGLRVMNGSLSLGTLVAFQFLVIAFMLPIAGLVYLGAEIQEAEGDMRRLDDVLHYPADPLFATDEMSSDGTPRLSGRIELRNVTFGYNRLEPPLIENFNLTLRPGSRVALVGASGSGKSTIANLVGGLYTPWDGQILFDGQPRDTIPRGLLTASLSVANQEVALFEGPIKDNLTMWDQTVPYESIVESAKDAHIHDEISSRPGGYGHVVEEDGRNFSGGQRQRMELARALVGNPSILVLDEATSALDPTTEQIIDDNLRRRGCTCLIIAHRLSTIRDADEIIVLERGKVIQRGTHEQMRRGDGPYMRLLRAGEKSDVKSKVASVLDAL